MKLIVHGQQAFGKSVLEALLERGEDVCAVYCAPDSGSRTDPLKAYAQEQGLPLFQPKTYKDESVVAEMKDLGADLCVMAYVTLMVPESALNAPRLGSIQYHPSLLPLHKGPSSSTGPSFSVKQKQGFQFFGRMMGWIRDLFSCRKKLRLHRMIRWVHFISITCSQWVSLVCVKPWTLFEKAQRHALSKTHRVAHMKAGVALMMSRSIGISLWIRSTT